MSGYDIHALRLHPYQDLNAELKKFVNREQLQAAWVMSAVGSLRLATLRLADQTHPSTFARKFEILALSGTMSMAGIHLHITMANGEGATLGGHLLDGCLIYTTCELVIGSTQNFVFLREQDAQTGYKELKILHKNG